MIWGERSEEGEERMIEVRGERVCSGHTVAGRFGSWTLCDWDTWDILESAWREEASVWPGTTIWQKSRPAHSESRRCHQLFDSACHRRWDSGNWNSVTVDKENETQKTISDVKPDHSQVLTVMESCCNRALRFWERWRRTSRSVSSVSVKFELAAQCRIVDTCSTKSVSYSKTYNTSRHRMSDGWNVSNEIFTYCTCSVINTDATDVVTFILSSRCHSCLYETKQTARVRYHTNVCWCITGKVQ